MDPIKTRISLYADHGQGLTIRTVGWEGKEDHERWVCIEFDANTCDVAVFLDRAQLVELYRIIQGKLSSDDLIDTLDAIEAAQ